VKPRTLFDLPTGDAAIQRILELTQQGRAELPPGCEVTYDLEAIEILRGLLRQGSGEELVRLHYEDFRERMGARPTATEMYHEGYKPRSVRERHGSWLGFVAAMGDLTSEEGALVRDGRPAAFLAMLETTPMTRSYKMLLLEAMLNARRFPGEISIGELAEGVRKLARRSALLTRDLGIPVEDEEALRRLLERNPIDAFTGGKGTGGIAYLAYEGGRLRATFEVAEEIRPAFADLVREIVDWRLAEYMDRPSTGDEIDPGRGFVCMVSHANGRPILFLPDRRQHPSIPEGWTRISADGEDLEAKLVKVALNVVRRVGSEENILPEILHRWFGDEAGRPGTRQRVLFEESESGLVMRPLSNSTKSERTVTPNA
jgi:hypothetical protein